MLSRGKINVDRRAMMHSSFQYLLLVLMSFSLFLWRGETKHAMQGTCSTDASHLHQPHTVMGPRQAAVLPLQCWQKLLVHCFCAS